MKGSASEGTSHPDVTPATLAATSQGPDKMTQPCHLTDDDPFCEGKLVFQPTAAQPPCSVTPHPHLHAQLEETFALQAQ